jgi:mRNA interferase RelE/StbE
VGYRVEIKDSAEKELRRFPKKHQRQIGREIDALAKNPRHHGCIKLTDRGGEHRVDVGFYRILYCIDDSAKTVRIGAIRNRKDAYR